MDAILPVLLFVAIAAAVSVGLVVAAQLIGPRRSGAVKEMPYESGMDPVHDTRRRFDVRFHLVAITFLVFDVELLFLYPWAVAKGIGQRLFFRHQFARESSRLTNTFSGNCRSFPAIETPPSANRRRPPRPPGR